VTAADKMVRETVKWRKDTLDELNAHRSSSPARSLAAANCKIFQLSTETRQKPHATTRPFGHHFLFRSSSPARSLAAANCKIIIGLHFVKISCSQLRQHAATRPSGHHFFFRQILMLVGNWKLRFQISVSQTDSQSVSACHRQQGFLYSLQCTLYSPPRSIHLSTDIPPPTHPPPTTHTPTHDHNHHNHNHHHNHQPDRLLPAHCQLSKLLYSYFAPPRFLVAFVTRQNC
jgi:hypothetical protein